LIEIKVGFGAMLIRPMDRANDTGSTGRMVGNRNQKAFHEAGRRRDIDMVSSQPILGSGQSVQETDFSLPGKGRLDYRKRSNRASKRNPDHMTMEKQNAVHM
jgi:hypothetical protein